MVICSLFMLQVADAGNNNVTMKKVKFNNKGIEMAGHLFLPEKMESGKTYPSIVCTSPAGSVKEQSSGLYARKLAEQGFVTLAFDPSHQAESGGYPRYEENPYDRVEDIRSAVDYLTTLPFIDRNRISAMGLCAGAGYTINAALTDRRIKVVVGVSGTDAGAVIRDGWTGGVSREEKIKFLEMVSEERTAIANGAEPVYGNYVPENVTEDLTVTMKEAHEYYRTPRAQYPTSENKVLLASMSNIYTFEAFHLIDELLTQPLLMIAGTKSDVLYVSERAIERAASKTKELYLVEGATHIDMYDRQPYVDKAIGKITDFLIFHLK